MRTSRWPSRGWLKEARQAFLLKPFAQDRLLETIRDQLDAKLGCGPDPLSWTPNPVVEGVHDAQNEEAVVHH